LKTVSAELVKKIAQNTRQEEKDVKKTLDALAFAIPDCLSSVGSVVYLKNIGRFELTEREGKVTELNGKYIKVKPHNAIVFRMSKTLGKKRKETYE